MQEIQKIIKTLERWNGATNNIFYIENDFFVMVEIEDDEYIYSLFLEDTYKKSFFKFNELISYKNEML